MMRLELRFLASNGGASRPSAAFHRRRWRWAWLPSAETLPQAEPHHKGFKLTSAKPAHVTSFILNFHQPSSPRQVNKHIT